MQLMVSRVTFAWRPSCILIHQVFISDFHYRFCIFILLYIFVNGGT